MPKRKTYEILRWPDRPEHTTDYELACSECGAEAWVPIGNPGCLIIAAIGLRLIFDPAGHRPPPNFMPQTIRCRNCRTVWDRHPNPYEVPASVR